MQTLTDCKKEWTYLIHKQHPSDLQMDVFPIVHCQFVFHFVCHAVERSIDIDGISSHSVFNVILKKYVCSIVLA